MIRAERRYWVARQLTALAICRMMPLNIVNPGNIQWHKLR